MASLSTSATVFSRATSKTDAKTGRLYWNEIVIAQGLPDSTGALEASQLKTLTAAGIARRYHPAC